MCCMALAWLERSSESGLRLDDRLAEALFSLRRLPILLAWVALSGFFASDAAGGQILLSWSDRSNNESGFKVERSTDNIHFDEIAIVGKNVTTYVDKGGLSLKQVYAYRVRAFNKYGNSGYSEVASIFFDPPAQFYFGSLGSENEGSFALMVRGDNTAVFLARLSAAESSVAVMEFRLSEECEFSFYIAGLGTFSGRVENDFVTGVVDIPSGGANGGLSIDSSGLPIGGAREYGNGATAGIAGFYDTGTDGESGGRIFVLAGPDGRGFVVAESASINRASELELAANGLASTFWSDGAELFLEFNGANGAVVGTLSKEGEEDVVMVEETAIEKRSAFSNVSIRAQIEGGATSIVGFVISGSGEKQVLIRAIGPGLGELGVENPLDDAQLILYRHRTVEPLAENIDWWSSSSGSFIEQQAARAGAFPLERGSKDSALLATLPAGIYSVFIKNRTVSKGTALIEVYDLDEVGGAFAGPKLVNLSFRGEVGGGSEPIIAGFVLQGDWANRVLIRAMGRELERFGVAGTLNDPNLRIYGSDFRSGPIFENDDWDEDAVILERVASQVGAFGFESGSKSAAKALRLDPGVYTAVVTGDGSGEVLVEMYEMP